MKNIQFKSNKIMGINRKRKIELEEDIDNYWRENGVKRRRGKQYENENFNLMTNVLYTAVQLLSWSSFFRGALIVWSFWQDLCKMYNQGVWIYFDSMFAFVLS